MTRRQQKAFVRGLIRSVQAEILGSIGRVPAEWDGHELRRLIRDKFAAAVFGDPGQRRVRSYRNEVITRDLL